jgi:hypothetical protein
MSDGNDSDKGFFGKLIFILVFLAALIVAWFILKLAFWLLVVGVVVAVALGITFFVLDVLGGD